MRNLNIYGYNTKHVAVAFVYKIHDKDYVDLFKKHTIKSDIANEIAKDERITGIVFLPYLNWRNVEQTKSIVRNIYYKNYKTTLPAIDVMDTLSEYKKSQNFLKLLQNSEEMVIKTIQTTGMFY